MNPFEVREKMTDNVQKSIEDTQAHINMVKKNIGQVIIELGHRSTGHDISKLTEPELPIFAEYGPKLAKSQYGSDEYETYRKEMSTALDHHYLENRHHPEHFPESKEFYCDKCNHSLNDDQLKYVNKLRQCPHCEEKGLEVLERYTFKNMNLIDIIELIADWKAATMRHNTGDIMKSIEINQKRFGYSDDIKQLLINTIKDMGWN